MNFVSAANPSPTSCSVNSWAVRYPFSWASHALDLSRKLLVLQLVQHAHTGVLPGPDPVLCPLLYQKLLFVDIPEHFHAVLPVYLPQHCYQLVLLHRFALLVLDRKLLTDLVAFMLELFLLLVHFVE